MGNGGPFVSKLSIQKCCLCAYKLRLYRLDGQQNRFDLYHVWLDHPRWSACASTRFYENRIYSCHIRLDHPRLSASTRFYENRVDSCHVRFDHPQWRKSTRFAQWRKHSQRRYTYENRHDLHTTCIRNWGTGLDLHTRSKHVPRGCCYFTGLMSFSFTSYCLLLSFFFFCCTSNVYWLLVAVPF